MPTTQAIESIATIAFAAPEPIGGVLIEATPRGVRQVRFVDDPTTTTQPALATSEHRAAERHAKAAAEQLAAYFAGQLQQFDLPLDLRGTPFQQQVWAELLRVPYAQTTTYARLAAAIGNPNACRAVGLANGANPVAVVVPCHRVVGSDGKLTGYAGGMGRKGWLLGLEGGSAELFAFSLRS